jgi:hypothetical protein
MDDSDRAVAVANLRTTRDAFQSSVAGVSEAQARFRPSPNRWSIEELVEHVAVAEYGMYRFISDLHKVETDPHTVESAATLAHATNRNDIHLEAPERVHPKNRFGSLHAALSKFLENRNRTIEYVQNCQDDLTLRIIDQHPLGVVNARDCLSILIHHPARHVEQINELKANPAFPR